MIGIMKVRKGDYMEIHTEQANMGYNVKQLETVIIEDECDKKKKIIVEVGGVQIPLQHVYVVDQEMIDDGVFRQDQIGTLVIDLDV